MAADVLGIPLLLRDVDEWLTQQEAEALTAAGGGALRKYNIQNVAWLPYNPKLTAKQVEARFVAEAGERYAWATGLATRYRLRSFAAAFANSVGRLPQENAAGLLQHVTEQALLR